MMIYYMILILIHVCQCVVCLQPFNRINCTAKALNDIRVLSNISGIKTKHHVEMDAMKLFKAVFERQNFQQRFLNVKKHCHKVKVKYQGTYEEAEKQIIGNLAKHTYETSAHPILSIFRASLVSVVTAVHFDKFLCDGFPRAYRNFIPYIGITDPIYSRRVRMSLSQFNKHFRDGKGGMDRERHPLPNRFQCLSFDILVAKVMNMVHEMEMHKKGDEVPKQLRKSAFLSHNGNTKTFDAMKYSQSNVTSSNDNEQIRKVMRRNHTNTGKGKGKSHVHANGSKTRANITSENPEADQASNMGPTKEHPTNRMRTATHRNRIKDSHLTRNSHVTNHHVTQTRGQHSHITMRVTHVAPTVVNHASHKAEEIRYRKAEVTALVIIQSLLKGYIFQPFDLPCPNDILQGIFSVYGAPGKIMNTNGIEKIFDDLARKDEGEESGHAHKHHPVFDDLPRRLSSQRLGDIDDESFCSVKHYLNRSISTADRPPRSRNHLKAAIFNASTIGKIYSGSTKRSFTIEEFIDICPAILLTVISNNSHVHHSPIDTGVSTKESYGVGSLCVLVISLASLLGAVVVRICRRAIYKYVMAGLVSLSVSCLLGDAVLHLLPFTVGMHDEMHDQVHGGSDPGSSNLYKLLGILGSIYLFFVIELILSKFHTHEHNKEIVIPNKSIIVESSTQLSTIQNNLQLSKITNRDTAYRQTSSDSKDSAEQPENSSEGIWRNVSNESQDKETERDIDTETCLSEASTQATGLRSLVWMVIIGDCIHNFADGLAIGAAFCENLTEGLSTSLAVLCHEIPHELGDFAVLVSSGMSIKRALLFNFLSSVTSFVGLYFGILASSTESARLWILSAGTGMFLYVALSDLIPELLRMFRRTATLAMFVILNVGMLTGFASMYLLALYEEHIKW